MIKMVSCVEFTKDEIISYITKGYKVKVDKKSYMFFEKEEDYLNLFILDKVYNDLYNNLFSDRDCEIRLYFRMILIEKFIESLPPIRIIAFYDYNRSENPFKVTFPNVGELNIITKIKHLIKKFLINLKILKMKIYKRNMRKVFLMLEDEKIKVKYFIKNEKPDNFLHRCFFMRKKCKPSKLTYDSSFDSL